MTISPDTETLWFSRGRENNSFVKKWSCVSVKQAWFLFFNIKTQEDIARFNITGVVV